jgi:dTDP-D-glucose 4,6-dehydratase
LVSRVLDAEGVDTVLNFAASAHVDKSLGNSLLFTASNTMGTHVVADEYQAIHVAHRLSGE